MKLISGILVSTSNDALFREALNFSGKSFLILLLAVGFHGLARKKSAATRHWILLLGMSALLGLPVIGFLTPHWRVPVMSAPQAIQVLGIKSQQPEVPGPKSPTFDPHPGIGAVESVIERTQPGINVEATAPALRSLAKRGVTSNFRFGQILMAGWISGSLLFLFPLLSGLWGIRRLASKSRSVTNEPLLRMLASISEELELRRKVVLLQSGSIRMPVTWGAFRQVILLPQEGVAWAREKQAAVLRHELAHIKRLDCLTQLVSWLACVVHWFNPLVWVALRKMRIDREQACDDLVLGKGIPACAYGHLLDIARQASGAAETGIVAIAMAKSSQLESRIKAILDANKARRSVPGYLLRIGFVFVLAATVPLASLHLTTRAQAQGQVTAAPSNFESVSDHPGLALKVINKKTGEAIAKAAILLETGRKRNYVTDQNGQSLLPVPTPRPRTFYVTVRAEGFIPMTVTWWPAIRHEEVPQEYLLKLEPGTSIGGTVQDANSQPVAGAILEFSPNTGEDSMDSDAAGVRNARKVFWDYQVTTDERGYWESRIIPENLTDLTIRVTHPSYAREKFDMKAGAPMLQQLRDTRAILPLEDGFEVTGRVLDADGKPLADVPVLEGLKDFSDSATAQTDANGEFHFNHHYKAGSITLTAQAPGRAPEIRNVVVSSELRPVEFRLAAGLTIRGRVVDQTGNPIQAKIGVSSLAREKTNQFAGHGSVNFEAKSGKDGRFKFEGAPLEDMLAYVFAEKFMNLRDVTLKAVPDEQILVMEPVFHVTGKVVDFETGEPVRNFRVISGTTSMGLRSDKTIGPMPYWSRGDVKIFQNGTYDISHDDPIIHGTEERGDYLLRIEADDYEPAISRSFKSTELNPTQDFQLKRAANLTGIVRSKSRQPVADVDILVINGQQPPQIQNGRPVRHDSSDAMKLKSKSGGEFSIPPQEQPVAILFLHDEGYAEISSRDLAETSEIILQPWGTVEGTFFTGKSPGAKIPLALFFDYDSRPLTTKAYFMYGAQTDESGNFSFTRIPPGEARLGRPMKMGGRSTTTVAVGEPFVVKAGETTRINVGGGGQSITGRLIIPDEFKDKIDFQNSQIEAGFKVEPPPGIPATTDAERMDWMNKWRLTPEGQAWMKNMQRSMGHRFLVNLNPDGSFEADDLPPGHFVLSASFFAPLGPGATYSPKQIAIAGMEFEVPKPALPPDKALDLGNVLITKIPELPLHR